MRRVAAILVAWAMFAGPMPRALAQPGEPAEPSAEAKGQARTLLDLGDAKMKEKKYQQALEAYQAADKIMGVPTTGIAVAQAQIELGRLVEAHDVLLRVTRYQPPKDNQAFVDAQKDAADLDAKIAPRIPAVTVKLADKGLPELRVVIDGEPVQLAGLGFPMPVNPGDHLVAASARGYLEAKAIVHVAEGENKDVPLELKKDPNYKPPPPPPAPLAPVQPPLGSTSAPLERELPPEQAPRLPVWGWIGYGVGAAGLLAGGISGGVALAKKSALGCGGATLCRSDQQSDITALGVVSNVSTAMFVVGGVGVATGLGATIATVSKRKDVRPARAALTIAPRIGPTSVAIAGTF